MLRLPNELLEGIAQHLEKESDLNSMAQTNHRLLECIEPHLYARSGAKPHRLADGIPGWGIDPRIQGRFGCDALEWAVDNNQIPTLRKAIAYRTKNVDLGLLMAAQRDLAEATQILLSAYSVEEYGTEGVEGALGGAAYRGAEGPFKILLDSGVADIQAMEKRRESPLYDAIDGSHCDLFRFMLSTGQFNEELKDKDGCTPLMRAAKGYKCLPIVQLLLDTGRVDIDSRSDEGRTPLSYAASNDDADMLQLLLDTNKVEVDSRDNAGRTPLAHAARDGNTAAVELLIGTGQADVNARDSDGDTPLMLAVWRTFQQCDTIKALLACRDVDVGARNNGGRNALWMAIRKRRQDAAELLVQTGRFDVEERDRFGRTPLSQAKSEGEFETYMMMLDWQKAQTEAAAAVALAGDEEQ